ncbi:hypothetical protein COCMIDRAFT_95969 [Bipolaris oryzae ATCC 44560]|uniref:Uncharacterized protein n=1 Tax=Bipolaris oryzae ATCC 44560 TaxID=930090 RepID=W6Z0L9_COCMI|nr:uncharacterized protein COCMIDRAFT_95969 [Bipolaris oryzae ATCC 44560]EUC45297.1 hypothetical protein COCMIDRAFT_95969 [Bipolaris oryzae ATCC 44560]
MQHEKDKRETTNTYTRRDSGVAQSCAKLPMFTEKCTNRAAIMNKPLPPVPRIKPAPKSVRMTGLPPSPHPITQPKNKKTSLTKPQSKTEPNPPRWKESRLTAPQTTLKSKISFRGLLTASKNGSVANNAAKRGIRDHTPPTHWRDAFVESAFEASKFIKQSAIEKLDEVIHATRRRKSSDVSFMCQGVEKGGLDVSD